MAAVLYSLIESAKLANVDPRKYLAAAVRRALSDEAPVTPQEFMLLAAERTDVPAS